MLTLALSEMLTTARFASLNAPIALLAQGTAAAGSTTSELAAAFLQLAVTLCLAGIFLHLYRLYRKRSYLAWCVAWSLYAFRLVAIVTFVFSEDRVWLYWHQVITGWTALAILWAALVFSQQLRWRNVYLATALFPLIWSWVAIYQMHIFLLAAAPAVAFLSGATIWAAWALARYHKQVGSRAALFVAIGLILWALHHLDYPFLRAQGAWTPWGYYIDLVFQLWLGAGMLLLVIEDQYRGLATLSILSGSLQGGQQRSLVLGDMLRRPLSLPAVKGSALYLPEHGALKFVAGAGSCAEWPGREPSPHVASVMKSALTSGIPEIARQDAADSGGYVAALPLFRGDESLGALVIVGDAVDPFAALDTKFLIALGRQVGAALENADLYESVAERTHQLEELAKRMVQQHEEERRRLSRELHDETAQVFSAVKMQLGVLREQVEPALEKRVDRVLVLMDEGIDSIRSVTHDLRPSLLDDVGLLPALRALVDEFAERSHIMVALKSSEHLPSLGADAELALFRALQEGLANVARHSGATAVQITLASVQGTVQMTVEDNGAGLPAGFAPADLEQSGHMGLVGMRERVAALGGSLVVSATQLGGVRLDVRLPAKPDRLSGAEL